MTWTHHVCIIADLVPLIWFFGRLGGEENSSFWRAPFGRKAVRCAPAGRRRTAAGSDAATDLAAVARLRSVFARWRAGTLRPPRPARPRAPRAGAASEERAPQPERPTRPAGPPNPPCAPWLLPRDFGWFKRLMPNLTRSANAFIVLVADPEMEAIVAAAPQVGRILRPFCHVLGLPLPEWLKLPKRKRKPRLRPRPRLVRHAAQAPASRESEKERSPKPVDVTKLSSVAYGDLIHPENEKHLVSIRPPNHIGYARSRWPPKKRD